MFAAPLPIRLAYPAVTSAPAQTPTARDREQLLVTIISESEDNLVHHLLMVTAPDGTLRHIVRRERKTRRSPLPNNREPARWALREPRVETPSRSVALAATSRSQASPTSAISAMDFSGDGRR